MSSPPTAAKHTMPTKQLATLAHMLVAIFLAAAFFRLRLIDSDRHKQDFRLMAALESITDISAHEVLLAEHEDPTAHRLELAAKLQPEISEWLGAKHKALDDKQRAARERIVAWLKTLGLDESGIGRLSGKGGRNDVPFLFYQCEVDEFSSPLAREPRALRKPTVALLLEEAAYLSRSSQVIVATEILAPMKAPPVRLSGASSGPIFELEFVSLSSRSELVAHFVENSGARQDEPAVVSHPIAVSTKEIPNVSLMDILQQKHRQLEALAPLESEEVYERISRVYGDLTLEQAVSVTEQHMLGGHDEVEMLGFKFSPAHFWGFVFIFNLVVLGASMLHLRHGQIDDEPTTFGLDYVVTRLRWQVVLWIVIPATSILLAFPREGAVNGWLWLVFAFSASVVITAATGALLVVASRRAGARPPAAA